jgi:hypothetical protein
MLDLKVVKLKDFAKVTGAEFLNRETVEQSFLYELGQSLPIILRITGEGFVKATDVIINGTSVPYTVQNATTILATLTESLGERPIKSISVLNDSANYSNTSSFSFEVGDRFEPTSGIEKAIAQFVKVLLTTPGSDDFDKTIGGGLNTLSGKTGDAAYTFLAQVALTLVRTGEFIRQRNSNLPLPNDEKLQSVEVISIDFANNDPSSIEARIRVNTLGTSNIPVALTLGTQGLLENLTTGVN